ncbi:hypothetical protein [Chondromyces apiculatus]|uniref:Uncharacterized protein n=1 Tax=Chondromyces apiculatus DSM 436 TaxID=1192034 RepID=A0A017TCR6_9BACT|nr:hypothetical protein [Chondromyces apiculatus]EYF07053.1 Hypothetical protein CAP_1312 [Chondromyces apiculatus DSM 436]
MRPNILPILAVLSEIVCIVAIVVLSLANLSIPAAVLAPILLTLAGHVAGAGRNARTPNEAPPPASSSTPTVGGGGRSSRRGPRLLMREAFAATGLGSLCRAVAGTRGARGAVVGAAMAFAVVALGAGDALAGPTDCMICKAPDGTPARNFEPCNDHGVCVQGVCWQFCQSPSLCAAYPRGDALCHEDVCGYHSLEACPSPPAPPSSSSPAPLSSSSPPNS